MTTATPATHPIYSMTGYATVSEDTAIGIVMVELKSVNGRFLEIQYRLSDNCRDLEAAMREKLMLHLARGKVECRINLRPTEKPHTPLTFNTQQLSILAGAQTECLQHFPTATPLSVEELLHWPGVLSDIFIDETLKQTIVQRVLCRALEALLASRRREGAALQKIILSRVKQMEAIVTRITPTVPEVIAQYQKKAMERITTLFNTSTLHLQDDAHERIRQEVTLYGIRIDIAEELSRLSTYLEETHHIIEAGGIVGKRLDFMMQELQREANTIGSKATVKTLTDASMELKLLIEQIREQVQNLE